ncbi:hypothetical protein DICPUDRAFT_159178 [Dictyostelium purpureum]|uniref:Uncharacterized protein n=1 Tax=Dictyostelium purpureum TaxID=5786 RepID=F1A3G8_DICPU|nr:uncharacterized protein DICPUDRAFT_159178 [Dictyostelium purpureum]EGC29257.1 hypothetical protein DICPUDRAFT_159178 [Dictyostelium purpureum]|eukprot:XP_003294210.1 hypothetical protein DICPUDRAFT_159178 [Dictyostelium purpureum]
MHQPMGFTANNGSYPIQCENVIVNYNSVTVFGSGMAATNSKSMTSGKNKTNSRKAIELEINDSDFCKVYENDDSKSGSGMDTS